MKRSHTVTVRLDEIAVQLDCPLAGDLRSACQAGRSWRGRGRIIAGQTPVAHHEACATRAESDFMGPAGAGSLYAFGVTQTSEQDSCDLKAFNASVLAPRLGEAQVSPAL